MTVAKQAAKEIRVTLVRSIFGRLKNHRDCVHGLGLTRMHQTVQLKATPEVMGMVNKVAYMLKIEQA